MFIGDSAALGLVLGAVEELGHIVDRSLAQLPLPTDAVQAVPVTVGGPPEVFAEHVRREREKWSRLIRERSITVN